MFNLTLRKPKPVMFEPDTLVMRDAVVLTARQYAVPRTYYPHWKAWAVQNGCEITHEARIRNGYMAVAVLVPVGSLG